MAQLMPKKTGQYPKCKKLGDDILEYMPKVLEAVGIGDDWRVYVKFETVGEGSYADCVATWQYKMAHLRFDLVKLGQEEIGFVLSTVRHEVMHIPLWRLHELVYALCEERAADLVNKHEEELTCFLEAMPVWTMAGL